MLQILRHEGRVSDRKLRLVACACARNVRRRLRSPACARAAEVAEQFIDGTVGRADLMRAGQSAWRALRRLARILRDWSNKKRRLEIAPNRVAWATALPDARTAAHHALDAHVQADEHARAGRWECDLLREIFGNPFSSSAGFDPAWRAWGEGVLVRLAQAAYDERDPERGTLDNIRLGVLADALEEAGCTDRYVLGHLRSGGDHVRGCFVVDHILGRG
jgi:hypothetical protein